MGLSGIEKDFRQLILLRAADGSRELSPCKASLVSAQSGCFEAARQAG
ncbi:hypothetical protein [Paenibacillus sp. HGF7]|nr:hypothetical protein [Paenibacillus sp. HGF7]